MFSGTVILSLLTSSTAVTTAYGLLMSQPLWMSLRKKLVVYVVNQSKNDAMETVITLTSGQFAGDVNVSVVNGPDVKAENTSRSTNQVGVREFNLKTSGTHFTYTFEPHSVTALVCPVS